MQHDRFNASAINSTVIATVTSNLRYAALPGNVRLRKGEAGLRKPSVVNVTQIATIDRSHIATKIGQLSRSRLKEIWEGLLLVLQPY